MTKRSILRAAGARSVDAMWQAQQQAAFFLRPSDRAAWTQAFLSRYPDGTTAIIDAANRTLRHDFDLLGSGEVNLGPALPWHTDFKTGREWPLRYAPDIEYNELDRPSDIKVPWELNRCQHLVALGQAYWLTGDDRHPQEFVAEVNDWIADNPWGYGVNWACAMDVGLRAVSWIWGFYFMSGSPACASPAFRRAFLRALYLHGEYVATHLERGEVNGNHYLCDGVALVFLGTFFRSTRKGRQWLALGKQIVVEEMFNQTTADGVDFEQSTAYHRLVLEAFLTSYLLLHLHGEQIPQEWLDRLERMFEFVEAYLKPDGIAPLVGDADDGRVQKLGTQAINDHRYLLSTAAVLFGRGDFKRAAGHFWDESFWLLGSDAAKTFDEIAAPAAPLESRAFPAGGFYVLRSDRAHLIVDCGDVGLRGRGGHGHSDILNFELWLDGTNLVTDCGTYLYTASREWRNRFRSTAFHNVVQVDGEELNRFVSPDHLWQLHDDAPPCDVVWRRSDGIDYFRGSHTGYRRLARPVTVTREIVLLSEGPDVLVRDAIGGDGRRELVWRFHLDPSVSAEIEGRDVRLSAFGREAWLQLGEPIDGSTLSVENGWMSPSYGVRHEIRVVVLHGRMTLPHVASFRFGLVRLPSDRLHATVTRAFRVGDGLKTVSDDRQPITALGVT